MQTDRQTNTQTEGRTDTQTNRYNTDNQNGGTNGRQTEAVRQTNILLLTTKKSQTSLL